MVIGRRHWARQAGRSAAALGVVAALGGWSGQALQPCEVARLTIKDTGEPENFGGPVSLNGDVAAIADFGVPPDYFGKVHVFRRRGSEWAEEAILRPPVQPPEIGFGTAVAVSGDVVVVGAPTTDAPEFHSGAAHVFRFDRERGEWAHEQMLIASDGVFNSGFGFSVDIDGDTILIGARDDTVEGHYQAGSAYVFRFNGQKWVKETKLTDPMPDDRQLMGSAVSLVGDLAAIGAHGSNGVPDYGGAVFVFRRVDSRWILDAQLLPVQAYADMRFGSAVAISSARCIVGALRDHTVAGAAGAAHVFGVNGSFWQPTQLITASDADANDLFGRSVSMDSSALLVGAPDDEEQGFESGSTYLFLTEEVQWVEIAKLIEPEGGPNRHFGGALSLDGDLGIIGSSRGAAIGIGFLFSGMSGHDCNRNGEADGCDIEQGHSSDRNGNGVPDECEPPQVPGDLEGDGDVDVYDLLALLATWGPCVGGCAAECPADVNDDSLVNHLDLILLLEHWSP